MICIPAGCRVFARAEPTDMRKGFAGLSGLVQADMGRDLVEGDLFVFMSRRRNSIKILRWDGTGLCIYAKRMARGRFANLWAHGEGGQICLRRNELSLLL